MSVVLTIDDLAREIYKERVGKNFHRQLPGFNPERHRVSVVESASGEGLILMLDDTELIGLPALRDPSPDAFSDICERIFDALWTGLDIHYGLEHSA